MTLRDLITKAGPISAYFGAALLLFCYNAVTYTLGEFTLQSDSGALVLLMWMIKLLIAPLVVAVAYGGIHDRQSDSDRQLSGLQPAASELERLSVFDLLRAHGLRFLAACTAGVFLYFVVQIAALLFAGEVVLSSGGGPWITAVVSDLNAVLLLFWLAALVVERRIFRSLGHALRLIFSGPLPALVAAAWFAVCLADSAAFDVSGASVPIAVHLARSAVFAVLKTAAIAFILVLYKEAWGGSIRRAEANAILTRAARPNPGEGLAKVSLGFALVSFIPVLHLAALGLGIAGLKRAGRFNLKAAAAVCAGGFFTALYALLLAGALASPGAGAALPGYAFLADADPTMLPYVDLLNEGAYYEVEDELVDAALAPGAGWTSDAALALARYNENDFDGALKDFYAAKQHNPERSEFYLYYGLALLDNGNPDMALDQFEAALEHQPRLAAAQQFADLVRTRVEPNQLTTAVMYLVILFFLFTVHEFGHAYAAHKLGDDTAKLQGRLTLNPAAHLDLVGSILLPALLLLQNSPIFFGWARPVPVDTRNFKRPERDHMLVSFAGPAVNLLVAMATVLVILVLVLVTRVLWPDTISLNLVDPYTATSLVGSPFARVILGAIVFLKQLFYTSLILGLFNLLPIPPLDGSWILAGVLPERFRAAFDGLRRFGFVIFMLLALTPAFDFILGVPLGFAWAGLRLVVAAMGFA